jgi:hypothetical protein
MTVHPHSLVAFEKIDLTNNQKIVLAAFRRGEGTDEQIAMRRKWSINRVCNRIGELIDLEKLEVIRQEINEFGNPVRVCRIKVKETLF